MADEEEVKISFVTESDTRGAEDTLNQLNTIKETTESVNQATAKIGQTAAVTRDTIRNLGNNSGAINNDLPKSDPQYPAFLKAIRTELRDIGVETQQVKAVSDQLLKTWRELGTLGSVFENFKGDEQAAAQLGIRNQRTSVIGTSGIDVNNAIQQVQVPTGPRSNEPVKVKIQDQEEPLTTVQPNVEREKPQVVTPKAEDKRPPAPPQPVQVATDFSRGPISAPITTPPVAPIVGAAVPAESESVVDEIVQPSAPRRTRKRKVTTSAPTPAPVAEAPKQPLSADVGESAPPVSTTTVEPLAAKPVAVTTVGSRDPIEVVDRAEGDAAIAASRPTRRRRARTTGNPPPPPPPDTTSSASDDEEPEEPEDETRPGFQARGREAAERRRIGPPQLRIGTVQSRERAELRVGAGAATIGPRLLSGAQLTRIEQREQAATGPRQVPLATQIREEDRQRAAIGPRLQTGAQLQAAELRQIRTPASAAPIGPQPLGAAGLTKAAEAEAKEQEKATRILEQADAKRQAEEERQRKRIEADRRRAQADKRRAEADQRREEREANQVGFGPFRTGEDIVRFGANLAGLGVGLSIASTAGKALNDTLSNIAKTQEETLNTTRILSATFTASGADFEKFSKEIGNGTQAFGAAITRQTLTLAKPLLDSGLNVTTDQVKSLVAASQDLANIRNEDPIKAYEALQEAIKGNESAASGLGLSLSDLVVAQNQLGNASSGAFANLDDSQKVALRYREALAQVQQQLVNTSNQQQTASRIQREAAVAGEQAALAFNQGLQSLIGVDPWTLQARGNKLFADGILDTTRIVGYLIASVKDLGKELLNLPTKSPTIGDQINTLTKPRNQNVVVGAEGQTNEERNQPDEGPLAPIREARRNIENGNVSSLLGNLAAGIGNAFKPAIDELKQNIPEVSTDEQADQLKGATDTLLSPLKTLFGGIGDLSAHLKETVDLNRARAQIPERVTNIEAQPPVTAPEVQQPPQPTFSAEALRAARGDISAQISAVSGVTQAAIKINDDYANSFARIAQQGKVLQQGLAGLQAVQQQISGGRSLLQLNDQDVSRLSRGNAALQLIQNNLTKLGNEAQDKLFDNLLGNLDDNQTNQIRALTNAFGELNDARTESARLQQESIILGGREAQAQLNGLGANRRVQDLQRGNTRDVTIARDLTVNPFERAAAQQRIFQRTVATPRAEREAIDANEPGFQLGRQQEVQGLLGRIAAATEAGKQQTLDVAVRLSGGISVDGSGGAEGVVNAPGYAEALAQTILDKIFADFQSAVKESQNAPSQALAGVPTFSR